MSGRSRLIKNILFPTYRIPITRNRSIPIKYVNRGIAAGTAIQGGRTAYGLADKALTTVKESPYSQVWPINEAVRDYDKPVDILKGYVHGTYDHIRGKKPHDIPSYGRDVIRRVGSQVAGQALKDKAVESPGFTDIAFPGVNLIRRLLSGIGGTVLQLSSGLTGSPSKRPGGANRDS